MNRRTVITGLALSPIAAAVTTVPAQAAGSTLTGRAAPATPLIGVGRSSGTRAAPNGW